MEGSSHLEKLEGSNLHRCRICWKVFSKMNSALSHKFVHFSGNFRCPYCNSLPSPKVYKRKDRLTRHIRIKHSEAGYILEHSKSTTTKQNEGETSNFANRNGQGLVTVTEEQLRSKLIGNAMNDKNTDEDEANNGNENDKRRQPLDSPSHRNFVIANVTVGGTKKVMLKDVRNIMEVAEDGEKILVCMGGALGAYAFQ